MTSYECFQGAARIESLAKEMYAGLAEKFAGRPYLRHLFTQLSAEEEQHALRILLLARHQGKAPWTADALERISGRLGVMAAEIESMKAEFARKDSAVDPGEIMRQVVDLERRFGAIHAQELARCADPEVQVLFAALAQQDARHQALIESARTTGEPQAQGRG
jgi:rubrerythrin